MPLTEMKVLGGLLNELQQEMQLLKLWQSAPMPPEAFASVQPFSIDTMNFAQWLQFVFIPRMQALLDAGAALPEQIDITPMAEVYFQPLSLPVQKLMHIILQIEQQIRHSA